VPNGRGELILAMVEGSGCCTSTATVGKRPAALLRKWAVLEVDLLGVPVELMDLVGLQDSSRS
jgi:hypothetical protein